MARPQKLGSVLKEVIDRYGYRERIDQVRAVEAWAFVAGPQINRVTETVWVKGATLFVQLSSASWRQQLHMQRREWCTRLNEDLGSDVIEEIVFR